MAYYNTSVPNPTLAARSAAAAPSPAHSRSTIHADTPVAQPSTSRGRTPKGTVPRAPEGREQRARSPPLGAVIEPSPVRRWRNYLYSALVCFLLTMLWSVLDPFDIAVNADVPSRYLPRSLAVKFVSGDNIKWIDELQDWEKLSDSIETMKKGDQKVDQGLPTSFGKGKNPNDVVTFGNSFGRNLATLFRLQVVSSRNMNLVHDLYENPDVHVPSWALQPIRGVGDCWKQRPSKESRYANDLTHSVRIPFSIELLQLALDRKDGPCTVELWGVVAWEDKEAMSRVVTSTTT
ncbi:unnamed protein product [Tilletia laevis]|uniref:SUN domain-containing protein n=2 Tax=Tilletia TaxID=13289 RepID=A0A177SWJ0_9BASI|nr:hypothetical protein CF336_g9255 [Tilletia laevis]KAE8235211.1 hypothetical protein A4X03_0g9861 [Tilletia caries]CAD6980113.1 unnamed protein product [Tilletia controversa]KAE8185463.1 hypothetical protein CF335_g7714 [Tilletia laevis]CAD6885608.1 unnamed protein product [Tilletia caries]